MTKDCLTANQRLKALPVDVPSTPKDCLEQNAIFRSLTRFALALVVEDTPSPFIPLLLHSIICNCTRAYLATLICVCGIVLDIRTLETVQFSTMTEVKDSE